MCLCVCVCVFVCLFVVCLCVSLFISLFVCSFVCVLLFPQAKAAGLGGVLTCALKQFPCVAGLLGVSLGT